MNLNWSVWKLIHIFPGGAGGKEPICQCRRHKRHGFDLWVRKISWRKAWQSTPVFLPGESNGQRSLAGFSPWGRRFPRVGHDWCDFACTYALYYIVFVGGKGRFTKLNNIWVIKAIIWECILHNRFVIIDSVQFSRSVVSDSLRPHGLRHARPPVHHQRPEFTHIHVHWVGDAIQPSHPLLSPSPPALNLYILAKILHL